MTIGAVLAIAIVGLLALLILLSVASARFMPLRPKQPCVICGALSEGGRCPAHRTQQVSQARRWTDEKRADDPIRRLYHTQRWVRVRAMVLRRDPICKIAKLCRGLAPSAVADHRIPARVYVAQGGSFFDMDNLQGVCEACHNQKTALEEAATASAPPDVPEARI